MRYLFCLPLTFVLSIPLQAAEITLVSAKPGDPPAVVVTGLQKEAVARLKGANLTAKQWAEVFRVVVAGGMEEELLARPPLAGTHTLTDTGIRFEPQFPLVPGREYVAILKADANAKPVRVSLSGRRSGVF